MSDRIEAEILDVLGEEVAAAVDTPLVVIEGPKGDPGKDGITPTIGQNGNWYLGEEDTGKPSRGEKGEKGDPGKDGANGETGPAGPRGEKGSDGSNGKDGAPGEKGDKGDPGIYYGTTQPTGDTHPVWIDPDGGPDDGGLLPAVTAADNGKVLRVDNGAWAPVDMPSGGGGETWELLSDTTIGEDVAVISTEIPPCKKIKAYFEGHQVYSDGSETSTKFTNLTADFDVDGNQELRPFYVLNGASRFNSDVVSVIYFDVSTTPFASGTINRIFPDGQHTSAQYYPVSNEIAITAASAITKITIRPNHKHVSGVGTVGRFASGGRFRIYGVKA